MSEGISSSAENSEISLFSACNSWKKVLYSPTITQEEGFCNMSWRNIFILALIIGAVHVVLVLCFSGGCRGCSSDPANKESIQEKGGDSADGSDTDEKPLPPPSVKAPAVKPWNYSNVAALPQKLAAQSARARSGIIVELDSRRVLWEKNSRSEVPVASLTKLMTALLVAEELENNPKFSPNDMVEISKTAAVTPYRKFNAGEVLTVKDLVAAMMVCSANDAAVQLAEQVSGSEKEFVKKMNLRAGELGLITGKFNSSNGLPQGKKRENSISTASDIIHLCEALMNFDVITDVCGKSLVKLSTGRLVYTTNGLLLHPTKGRSYRRKVPGMIGFKTGYTEAAGCCLAFGVTRDGKTVLGCVTGFRSAADRERFCNDLIEWAYKTQVKK